MSIADKLTLLTNTKQDIKSAISEKGVEVTGGMTTYADAIRRIETGGGGGGDSFYVPIGLKFSYQYQPGTNAYTAPKFTLPKLILADGYYDGSYMFDGNQSLVSIKDIYSPNPSLTTCEHMFRACKSLTAIPKLNTSNVTDMEEMFAACGSLTTIPQLDTSKVIFMDYMFAACESLTTIPQLNTSNVTSMDFMFWKCRSLTTIPMLDTSNVSYMECMFLCCNSLTAIPKLNTSKVGNMGRMFVECTNLTTIPQLDTSRVIYVDNMFTDCFKLKSLPLLDFSEVTNATDMFSTTDSSVTTPYPELTDLGGFKNLKVSLYGLDGAPNLTVQSIMNVINNLYDYKASGSTTYRFLGLGITNINKLTDEQKAVATNKGWKLQ